MCVCVCVCLVSLGIRGLIIVASQDVPIFILFLHLGESMKCLMFILFLHLICVLCK